MKLFLVVLSLIVVQTSSVNVNSRRLSLTIYYESKCEDSRRFIVNQLAPTVRILQDYIDLTLIPFGKASLIDSQRRIFACQHGPLECRGNMVQDCTIRYMAGRPNSAIVDYVKCEMETKAGTLGDLQCVRGAHVPVQNVQNCLTSGEGFQLQLKSQTATKLINPSFVPTVIVNGRYDMNVQRYSQVDLIDTLCSRIPEAPPCIN